MTATADKQYTWEQAALAAINSIDFPVRGLLSPNVYLDDVDYCLLSGDGTRRFERLARWAEGGYRVSTSQPLDRAALVALIAGKQHDYGHDNILRYGLKGIEVRISDKVCRLRNLLGKGVDGLNESIEDSWRDIVGYAVIAIMLENGTFELPLAADAPKRTVVKLGYESTTIEEPYYFDRDADTGALNRWVNDGFHLMTLIGTPAIDINIRSANGHECHFFLAEVEA